MDLKIKDVAELLKVSETTIRRWLSEGKIPAYRLNHQYRFSLQEIESWMISCKLKAASSENLVGEPEEVHELPVQGGTQHFILYRALHQGAVLLQTSGKTKEELIRNATQTIAKELVVDPEVLTELLLDREALMPTALNRGVAVPHTREFIGKGAVDRVFVVYPEEPLEYGALDGQPVHTLFFLFASSDKHHLHLLAKIAHLCSREDLLEKLKCKPKKQALLELIYQAESGSR